MGLVNRRSQFQWIVLLSAAIVLPTVSLLWFMSRVVINERLVIRQKLGALYEGELKEASAKAKHQLHVQLDALNSTDWLKDPNGLLRRLVLEEQLQGVLIWSSDGSPAFPSAGDPSASNVLSEEQLNAAWQLEFVEQNIEAAAEQYAQLTTSGDPRAAAGQSAVWQSWSVGTPRFQPRWQIQLHRPHRLACCCSHSSKRPEGWRRIH